MSLLSFVSNQFNQQLNPYARIIPLSSKVKQLDGLSKSLCLRKLERLLVFSCIEGNFLTNSYGRLPLFRMKLWRTDPPPSNQPNQPTQPDRTYLNGFFPKGSSNQPLQSTPLPTSPPFLPSAHPLPLAPFQTPRFPSSILSFSLSLFVLVTSNSKTLPSKRRRDEYVHSPPFPLPVTRLSILHRKMHCNRTTIEFKLSLH